jgi:nucleoside-diphosphate-sugar epimerase
MSVGAKLEMLKSMAPCPIQHCVEPLLLRPCDVTLQIPETSRFRAATGWRPEIPLETTLRDLLDYQREKVRLVKTAMP